MPLLFSRSLRLALTLAISDSIGDLRLDASSLLIALKTVKLPHQTFIPGYITGPVSFVIHTSQHSQSRLDLLLPEVQSVPLEQRPMHLVQVRVVVLDAHLHQGLEDLSLPNVELHELVVRRPDLLVLQRGGRHGEPPVKHRLAAAAC